MSRKCRAIGLAAISLFVAGSGSALAGQEPPLDDEIGSVDESVAKVIALTDLMIDDIVPSTQGRFSGPQSPFGLDLTSYVPAVTPDRALGVAIKDLPGTNVDVYVDGLIQEGDSSTSGGVDDEFAIPGDHRVLVVEGSLPDDLDEHFVEIAFLIRQDGLEASTADPRISNDFNAGFTGRYAMSVTEGVFDVSAEIVLQGAWTPVQSVVDFRFDTDGSRFAASAVFPARSLDGADRYEAHLSTYSSGSTDPGEASVFTTTMELANESLVEFNLADFPDDSVYDGLLEESRQVAAGILTPEPPPVEVGDPTELDPAPTPDVESDSDQPLDDPDQVAENPRSDAAAGELSPENDVVDPQSGPSLDQTVDLEPEPVAEEPVIASDPNSTGGLSPAIPIGGVVLVASLALGVTVGRRQRHAPLPIIDDEAAEAPLRPVPAPLIDSRSEADITNFQARELLRISKAEGNEPGGNGWVEITAHAYNEVFIGVPNDSDLFDQSEPERAARAGGIIIGGQLVRCPDDTTRLYVHENKLTVMESEIERTWDGERPVEVTNPIENNDATLSSAPDDVVGT